MDSAIRSDAQAATGRERGAASEARAVAVEGTAVMRAGVAAAMMRGAGVGPRITGRAKGLASRNGIPLSFSTAR
tara:strand:+ start:1009 stop:1230 length:222 start_codon:yes stop_codon:yes gene_type:complete